MDRSKILLICFGACLFFLFLFLLTPNFETNDDAYMLLIASGGLTGMPDEHIIFSNILIGHALKALYGLYDGVSWYTIYLLSTHFVAMILIFVAYAYRRHRETSEFLLFILIYLLGYLSLFLVKLQFTSTAFIAGFAALYFLHSEFQFRIRFLASGALFVLAFLIRHETFIPLMVIGLISLFKIYQSGAPLRPYFLWFFLITLIYTGTRQLNLQDPTYKKSNYYAYQKAADIICNNPMYITQERLNALGLSRNDMDLFSSWFWVDRELFPDDKIISISHEFRHYVAGTGLAKAVFRFVYDERFALLMFAVSFWAVFVVRDRKIRIFLFINTFLITALILYLLITARLPKRVSTPLLFYLFLIHISSLFENFSSRRWRYTLLGLLFILSGYKFWCVYQLSETNKKEEYMYIDAVKVINEHPDDVFVVIGKAFPAETMNVFKRSTAVIQNSNLILTGWFINTPTYFQLLQKNGITNVLDALRDRRDVVLVLLEFKKTNAMNQLEQYYLEHDRMHLRVIRDEKMIGSLHAHRLVPQ